MVIKDPLKVAASLVVFTLALIAEKYVASWAVMVFLATLSAKLFHDSFDR